MCADVRSKFRRRSNILSGESQMTGADGVLNGLGANDPIAGYQ
jgi:hypothetical protein